MSSDIEQSHDEDEANQPAELKIEAAISDLNDIIENLSSLYHQLKEIKYECSVRTCEILRRIDFPSVMIEAVRKEIKQVIPSVESVEKM